MNAEKEIRTRGAAFLFAVLSVAAVPRAPITGVGTLVNSIQSDLALSGSVAGFLTTIPLLAFAVVSPFVGALAGRFGLGRTLCVGLILTTAGCLCRSFGGTAGLLIGTTLAGVGISAGNVLLPVVVKGCYGERIGPMTGIYTTAQSIFAGLASAISVPLAVNCGLGWRVALAIWAIPSLAAALMWFARRSLVIETPKKETKHSSVLRSPVAWFVTLYMGSQAILYYSSSAWFPAILAGKGISDAAAGLMASLYQWIGILSNFITPMLAAKMKSQRVITGCVSGFYITGMSLMWLGRSPAALTAAVLLCGFSTGCCFSLCMALIGLRTRNAADAAALSGMTQSVGYLIAAVGPVLVGALRDVSGGWGVPCLALVVGTLINAVMGQLAGKPGIVGE